MWPDQIASVLLFAALLAFCIAFFPYLRQELPARMYARHAASGGAIILDGRVVYSIGTSKIKLLFANQHFHDPLHTEETLRPLPSALPLGAAQQPTTTPRPPLISPAQRTLVIHSLSSVALCLFAAFGLALTLTILHLPHFKPCPIEARDKVAQQIPMHCKSEQTFHSKFTVHSPPEMGVPVTPRGCRGQQMAWSGRPSLNGGAGPPAFPDLTQRAATIVSALEDLVARLEDAFICEDLQTSVSVAIGETTAGVFSGLATHSFAQAIQDEKRNSTMTDVASTGVYFGVQALTKAGLIVFGVPQVLADASLGSLASALVKFTARAAEPARVLIGGLPSGQSAEVIHMEVAGDVSTWFMYDLIVSSASLPNLEWEKAIIYFFAGSAASCIGHTVQESKALCRGDFWKIHDLWESGGFGKTMLEGGVLFMVYQESTLLLEHIIPEEIAEKSLWFKELLDACGAGVHHVLAFPWTLHTPV